MAGAQNIQWPLLLTVRDLIRAMRDGFDLVMLPLPEHATPSTAPAYVLSKGGVRSQPGKVSSRIARAAITGQIVGHPMKCHDGAFLYKLTTRASDGLAPADGSPARSSS